MQNNFSDAVKQFVNAAMSNITTEIEKKKAMGQYRLTVGLLFAGSPKELNSAISFDVGSRLSDMQKDGQIATFIMIAQGTGANIEILLPSWDKLSDTKCSL